MTAGPVLIIAGFFMLFFWPATLAGRYFVYGDSLVYQYPLRVAAWDMIRHGTLPLWTPHILSGYPLLAITQLALGYPLTWGYLFLPGHVAEQVYVLAPYLLAPAFTYAYLRTIGRSRIAALLAGLTFTYGGMMAGLLANTGAYSNAVMWLPLMLVAIERARTGRFLLRLTCASAAYAMAVLTGVAQAFVYAGILALAYAAFVSALPTPPDPLRGGDGLGLLTWHRWKPLAVGLGGIVLAAGLAAVPLLETLRAHSLSMRHALTYDAFSRHALTPRALWRSIIIPLDHLNYEATSYLPLFSALFVLVAVAVTLRAPRANQRALFWLVVAAAGLVLMTGRHTPVYKLVYHIPLVNLFRVPWRHAFEWTFAASILAAYGWDASMHWLGRFSTTSATWRARNELVGVALLLSSLVYGLILLNVANAPGLLRLTFWPTGSSEAPFLVWKVGYTILLLLTVVWARWRLQVHWGLALCTTTIAIACFWEQYLLVSRWWFPHARPAAYFTQVSPPMRFLLPYPPDQNRIYTSVAQGFMLDLPRFEPLNLAARHGFQNAAGYEPLMTRRYNQALGAGWSNDTPGFSAPADRQLLDPRWQVLDLLNVRFLVEFAAPAGVGLATDGVRFALADAKAEVQGGKTLVLAGTMTPVDSLSLVTSLTFSRHLAQGETVAHVIIHASDGRTIERQLKAGVDSADAAHERPDVKASVRHELARVFDSRPADERESFPTYRYWTRLDLNRKTAVTRVEIRNVVENVSLVLWRATLYDAAAKEAVLLTQLLPAQWRKVYEQDDVLIYENQRVLPRVWLVPSAVAVSPEDALSRIRGESQQDFHPREIALLEPAAEGTSAFPQGQFTTESLARIVRYEPSRLEIETYADKSSVLVVSEISYPGWEATIDGRPATILTADYLLRSVLLPAGSHRVELRYTAASWPLGASLSAGSLLFMAGAFVRTRVRK